MEELLGTLKVHEIELRKDERQRKYKFVALKVDQGLDSLTNLASRGDFRLDVPDTVEPESMGTRLGDQGAEARLSLRCPLA
ncbi:hypothetical protein CR513_17953, partial [Mucuna pruriens]